MKSKSSDELQQDKDGEKSEKKKKKFPVSEKVSPLKKVSLVQKKEKK